MTRKNKNNDEKTKKQTEEDHAKKVTTNRTIFLSDDVNESSVLTIMERIDEINHHDDEEAEKTTRLQEKFKHKRRPITLIVNTGGGSVLDGNALIGAIQLSKTPIHTVAMGHVMSMGVPIFLAGEKRKAHAMTSFMYHDLAYGSWGKIEEHEQELKYTKFLAKQYDDFCLSRCKLDKVKMKDHKKRKAQWYFDTKEALKMGVIEEII